MTERYDHDTSDQLALGIEAVLNKNDHATTEEILMAAIRAGVGAHPRVSFQKPKPHIVRADVAAWRNFGQRTHGRKLTEGQAFSTQEKSPRATKN